MSAVSSSVDSSSNNIGASYNNDRKKRRRKTVIFRSLILPSNSDEDSQSYSQAHPNHGVGKDGNNTIDRDVKDDSCYYYPHHTNQQDLRHPTAQYFLPAIQLLAHVLSPLRKALVHFYMSTSKKEQQPRTQGGGGDINNNDTSIDSQQQLRLEWQTLHEFGRLFQQLVTAPSSQQFPNTTKSSDASTSVATTTGGTSTGMGGDDNNNNINNNNNNVDYDDDDDDDDDEQQHDDDDDMAPPPVDATQFLTTFMKCCVLYQKSTVPNDATMAVQILLEVLYVCTKTLPVTSHLWTALLDMCGMGLIAKQSIVGRLVLDDDDNNGVILQRTKKDSCIMYCPLTLPLYGHGITGGGGGSGVGGSSDHSSSIPSLFGALERYCSKQPYPNKSYDFDRQPFDFEVKIPSTLLFPTKEDRTTTTSIRTDKKSNTSCNSNQGNGTIENTNDYNNAKHHEWQVTRSMQFTSLPTYLFLGIQRMVPVAAAEDGDEGTEEETTSSSQKKGINNNKFHHNELTIPATLDVAKLCLQQQQRSSSCLYRLVGGVLFDEGDYVAVLRNPAVESEDDDEAWNLMESEEVIPMSQADVLEFLKGGAGEQDDDDDDEGGGNGGAGAPCGTLAVYRRVTDGTTTAAATTTTTFSSSSSSKRKNLTDDDIMNQLLSDLVISQVSGTLDSNVDYYYEEEIIEE